MARIKSNPGDYHAPWTILSEAPRQVRGRKTKYMRRMFNVVCNCGKRSIMDLYHVASNNEERPCAHNKSWKKKCGACKRWHVSSVPLCESCRRQGRRNGWCDCGSPLTSRRECRAACKEEAE